MVYSCKWRRGVFEYIHRRLWLFSKDRYRHSVRRGVVHFPVYKRLPDGRAVLFQHQFSADLSGFPLSIVLPHTERHPAKVPLPHWDIGNVAGHRTNPWRLKRIVSSIFPCRAAPVRGKLYGPGVASNRSKPSAGLFPRSAKYQKNRLTTVRIPPPSPHSWSCDGRVAAV